VFARIVSMRLKPNAAAEFSQTIEKKILRYWASRKVSVMVMASLAALSASPS
jgi:hypothetical protein